MNRARLINQAPLPASVTVIGAGGGIGSVLAVALASEGRSVACLDRDGSAARLTADHINETGHALDIQCDADESASVNRAAREVRDRLGPIGGLVVCVGGSRGCPTPFLEIEDEQWSSMLVNNLTTAFISGRAFARQMAATGGGSIVMITSQLSLVVRPGFAHYGAAKAGLAHLARGMAVDLAPSRIRVNNVAPGPTDTPIAHDFFEREDVKAEHADRIPMGRVASAQDMVGAVQYLLSSDSQYTTGSTIVVDGGYTLV